MGNTTLMDYLNDIARAVQSKTGTTKKIKLKDLADEIDGIDALETHEFANDATHPLTINSNGEYNIYDDNFSHIVVNIPFAGDDLAPYFQNQTGSGPYTMVYYNHMLPGMLPGGEVEEATEEAGPESEEVSEVGYSSYDFNIGDGGVAFLTYDYNSSSHIYGEHSVSFYKYNLSNDEIIARENYYLSGNSGDNKYSDVTLVDLNPGSSGSSSYPVVYYHSSGYLVKSDNVATPGYVSWRNSSWENMQARSLDVNEFVYKNSNNGYNIETVSLYKDNNYLDIAHLDSYGAITIDTMESGNFYYIDASDEFNYSSGLVAYVRNDGYVDTLGSNDRNSILYYHSSSQYFTATDLNDTEILYNGGESGKEKANLSSASTPAGIYSYYNAGSSYSGIYLQRLSDQNSYNRVLVGAGYNDSSFQTYKCMPDNVLYFTVSSGQTYVNTLSIEATNATTCNIIIPTIDNNNAYSYNFNDNVINTYASKFNYSTETHSASTFATAATLTTKKIAYLTTGSVNGYTRAYGDIATLYPATAPTGLSKSALRSIYVAYHSAHDDRIELGQIYGDDGFGHNVLKAYHLGDIKDGGPHNGEYCVVSTDLSYSFSNGTDGYTNNFITVLYPQITNTSYDSTQEKATIHHLAVRPNKYYTLKYNNVFSDIDGRNIYPIKLGTSTPTYNWVNPNTEAGADASITSNIFGFIRIYQSTNGSAVDVPVTYNMITALADAGLIDTDYEPPVVE